MKPEIKKLHSPDVEELSNYFPEEMDYFGFLLQIIIGEKGKEGEESFDVFVCTPKWLIKNNAANDIILGFHYIIMFKYSYKNLYSKINSFVESIEGHSWNEIGLKMSKIGRWEFDDYKEMDH